MPMSTNWIVMDKKRAKKNKRLTIPIQKQQHIYSVCMCRRNKCRRLILIKTLSMERMNENQQQNSEPKKQKTKKKTSKYGLCDPKIKRWSRLRAMFAMARLD